MCTKNLELIHLIKELQSCTEDTIILRRLINYASSHKQLWNDESLKQWQPVLTHVIQLFIPNSEVQREKTLLASHTFFALLSMESTLVFLNGTLTNFLTSNSNALYFLNEKYNIVEFELFKLISAYGYLQVNCKEIYSNDICSLIFCVTYEHCIRYTKHSYFAYKVLELWLHRTMCTNFWDMCDLALEQKLEAIIFSNWCNAINEISKQNSVSIFNMYLKIMEKKYNGYLEFVFKHCIDRISWQNEVKYDILAEICNVWDNINMMTSRDFLLSLSTSLTKYNLRSAGTKAYIAIIKKITEDEWKTAFGCIMNYLFHHWETTENANYNALQLLCKHWLEPIIKKYKSILPYLWNLTRDIYGYFLRSHLQRIAGEVHIDLPQKPNIECYINHKNEVVRLNGFAISCYEVNNLYDKTKDQFFTTRNFLWHNANSTTVCMRDGIVRYFKVFFASVLKMCDTKPDCINDVFYITHWLHEFLLDCFEIGSCYQRKILGLNLYKAMLSFTNANGLNKFSNIENASCTLLVQKHLKATDNWQFTNKASLFCLLRLVLDSALDVKQLSNSIILDYFDLNILTNSEKQILYRVALKYSNSSKFYEIESGTALISILANWLPFDILAEYISFNNCSSYTDFLFHEAASQLTEMKQDILKAIVQNKPFYGVLTALLNITFRNGPENSCLTLEFVKKLLHLLKDASNFFLSILSSKSENTEYSSSFAEMGLAIDNAIKNSKVDNIDFEELCLTPAHQVLISCIWMSLKVSCEIASEIGTLRYSYETVKCSADIIVTVLLRCRHKGVVEAAGTAVGHLTRCLCKEAEYYDLPKMHVLRILEDNAMNSLNITRRGAGLSIMFHRIVVSDNRRDRPLLHFAVQRLLDLLDNISDVSPKSVECQHDSPCARRLHFLRALVADKEIHAQLIPYMERISLTCFKYLESEIWTIRNASLQLFGAIVPRLVGQSYGQSVDFGNGYPINHFVTHYPILANYVMKEVQNFSSTFMDFSTALYLHSNVVHILILLSKFSNSGSNLIDYSSEEFVSKMKHLLRTLFKNPVLYVRLLAAKAYAALTDFLNIECEIMELKHQVSLSKNANLIHGYLLTMKYLKEKLLVEVNNISLESAAVEYVNQEPKQCAELLRLRKILQIWGIIPAGENKICYILEVLCLQLSESISDKLDSTDIFCFDQNISVLSSERIKPGFFQFIDHSTKLYADYVRRTNFIDTDTLHKILVSHCIDQSSSFLNNVGSCMPVLKIVLEHLLLNEHNCSELHVNAMVTYALDTLKHLSLSDMSKLNMKNFVKNLSFETRESVTNSKLWRLKFILIIMYSDNDIIINRILSHVLNLCVHEEEYKRQIAVELIQFSIRRFAELTNANKLTVLHCCLILLKDEISEIRDGIAENLRAHILQTIEHDECMYQSLLKRVMLGRPKFVTNKDMNLFFLKLFTHSIKNFDVNAAIENPFYHDDNPAYREESKFLNLCFYYIRGNKYNSDKCSAENTARNNNERLIDVLDKMEAKYRLQQECLFDNTNLDIVLNIKYVEYLLRKQKIVIQEYS
ncbi:PREDICTED: uncharacterized protein LOC107194452 [Dufourea novaeangliae]|uniref:Thyroid adenoma-associated protein like protein n=1 Tax=Dufourea novaeangliae TaxID=178035 RepID=A0A154P2S1_DUFNO|nr:PREDICTED: uncharacterized protein LOC107194452 [Dufourea novaeangliae]KZC06123.1 Thyroid adenoma-associated protein like protein [Dufourea novaeangliae]